MHCASCAQIITKKISTMPHVHHAEVNYANEKAKIEFDETKTNVENFNSEIKKLGYSLVVENEDHSKQAKASDAELSDFTAKTEFILPITLTVFVLMMWDILARLFPFIPNLPIPMQLFTIHSMALATVALFWVGKTYLNRVVRFIK